MLNNYILLLVSILTGSFYNIQAQTVTLKEITKLPQELHESSGLIADGDKIWSHNDSRGEPVLYGFDLSGKITDAIYIKGKNVDWEDITEDNEGNFYVGDFGNGDNKRRDLKIYKISNPKTAEAKFAEPTVIAFSYSDQKNYPPQRNKMNFDMEAMIHYNGYLYLFSKNRTEPFTGYTKLYKLPDQPGTYVAELIDSVYLGPAPMLSNWTTSAAISPDNKKLILLGHDKCWLFTCFEQDKFFSGEMKDIRFPSMTQKEGICFSNNNEVYISDELTYRVLGGKLYRLNLNTVKTAPCK